MSSLGEKTKKRSTSVITVFLWLLLIVTMSTILIGSVFQENKLEYDRTITIKIDYTDLINSENIPDEDIDDYLYSLMDYIFATNNHVYNGEYDLGYIEREGNIVTYELSFNSSEINYIEIYLGNMPYDVLENGMILEIYTEEYGYPSYIREITEEQNLYEFKLQKIEFDTTIELKIDITDLLNDETIPNDYIDNMLTSFGEEGIHLTNDTNLVQCDTRFIGLEGNIANYQIDFNSLKANDMILDVIFFASDKSYCIFDNKGVLLEYDLMRDGYINKILKDQYIYEFKIEPISDFYSGIKWGNIEKKEVLLEFTMRYWMVGSRAYAIFVENLTDEFTISPEYENQSNWLIVNESDIINDDIDINDLLIDDSVPKYVYANFFNPAGDSLKTIKWNEKYQYIYVKDKNILYILFKNENYQDYGYSREIKLQYDENINQEIVLDSKMVFLNMLVGCANYASHNSFLLGEKMLNVKSSTMATIEINKLIENATENVMQYVGLFENDVDSKTDQIYPINTVDGIGSTVVTIDNYDGQKPYYIYEVDEEGNKISNEELDYSKNEVLKDIKPYEEKNIITDKSVISMVGNSYLSDEDTIGSDLGEDFYRDNVLVTNYIYKDTVTITEKYEEKVHVVKFEAEEGGTIEGETSVVVKDGETIDTIVNAIANEHYNFDKWVVIENGAEKEVDPSSYVINEDITFIAKFKKDVYTVKYESSEGGKLEGNIQEKVEYGENLALIPSVVSDENYEFDKWVIVENGEEIQIDPSSYKVEKDVTIIAKFKKINTIETSDIEVWKYVGIGAVSVFVIGIIVLVIIIRKKNKNK